MSTKFETLKQELAAGGSVRDNDELAKPDRETQILGGAAWIGVFVLLGFISKWMLFFALGTLISILLHEVGHFYTARKSGMKVTQFFIGFGPRVWSFHRNGIEYGLRVLPLGAFVKIIGMNNLDEIGDEPESRTYRAQSYPKRMWVITAGSAMHMIIAIVLITAVYATAGRLQESGTVVIGSPPELDSPAGQAGLLEGDIITAINGDPMSTSDGVRAVLRGTAPGTTLDVTVRRGDQVVDVTATLIQNPNVTDSVAGYLGVGLRSVDRVGLPIASAVGRGGQDLATGVGQAIQGIVKILNPVNVYGHLVGTNDDASTRPTTLVGATRISDDVGVFDGWAGLLSLLAALNLSVGVFNMFPLLPLDGGHAAIATYERIRSRKGKRYTADVAKLMPVLAVTVMLLAFMFLTGLYLDTVKPIR
jgi:membrane-associated protease RseP (regulator of RpoE activity)